MDVTNETLGDIGVESIPTINVYNKADLADMQYPRVKDQSIWMSAGENKGIPELLELIQQTLFREYVTRKLLIPYDRGDVVSYINETASVRDTTYEEEGTLMTVEMRESESERLREFVLQ